MYRFPSLKAFREVLSSSFQAQSDFENCRNEKDDYGYDEHPAFTNLEISPLLIKEFDFNSSTVARILQDGRECPSIKSVELIGLHVDRTVVAELLRLLQTRILDKLALIGCTGRDTFSIFAMGLSRVRALHLKGLVLDAEAFAALGLALQVSCDVLQDLSLTWFSLERGILPLVEGLAVNRSLQQVSFTGCELRDGDITLLLEALQEHPCIRKINLEDNHCHQAGSKQIANLLENQNQTLKVLNLSEQSPLPASGVSENSRVVQVEPIAAALVFNTGLVELDLSFNQLGDEDLIHLADALVENSVLRNLDLGSNDITDAGIMAFSSRLPRMKGLRSLILSHNPFGNIDSLVDALETNLILEHVDVARILPRYNEMVLLLSLNRGGRKYLTASHKISLSHWPLILARCDRLKYTNDIRYHLLKGPALFEANG